MSTQPGLFGNAADGPSAAAEQDAPEWGEYRDGRAAGGVGHVCASLSDVISIVRRCA